MFRVVAIVLTFIACGPSQPPEIPTADGPPPPGLVGAWHDDYGSVHDVSHGEWFHRPSARYQIVRWNVDEQYLIAQNDPANPSEPSLWTRIDWLELDATPPYRWAFCLTAYDAKTADAAEATPPANRAEPKIGCNGFPFTRLRPSPRSSTTP